VKALEYEKMYRAEKEFWWFAGKGVLVKAWSRQWLAGGKEFLDVGCGTGANLERVSGLGHWTGFDAEAEAIRFCVERGHKHLCRGRAEKLPFGDGAFDGALALDILEHLDGDAEAVVELFRVLRPGSRAIISVPAGPFLWGTHDMALGHKRRYTRAALGAMLTGAGFSVLRLTHFMGLLFPAAFLIKLLQKRLGDPEDTMSYEWPGPLNQALLAVVALEVGWLKKFGMPAGTTLAAVVERPRQPGGSP
jgi:SAM-dependent methyltransferase